MHAADRPRKQTIVVRSKLQQTLKNRKVLVSLKSLKGKLKLRGQLQKRKPAIKALKMRYLKRPKKTKEQLRIS